MSRRPKIIPEKQIILQAVDAISAGYSSGCGSDSPNGYAYPCTRVLSRMLWYRKKTMRCKAWYHLFSALIVAMPLASTTIKIFQKLPDPLGPLDYADIFLPFLTSFFAFLLGHFRFLEKWERYRKFLERALHICTDGLIDKHLTYESTVEVLRELENLFKEDTKNWIPHSNEGKDRKKSVVDAQQ